MLHAKEPYGLMRLLSRQKVAGIIMLHAKEPNGLMRPLSRQQTAMLPMLKRMLGLVKLISPC